MLHKTRVVLVSLGLGLGVAGCNSFLTGDKLSSNPNSPNSATIQTLFVAMQGGQFAEHEGPIAMLVCEWVQQCGATSARFVELGGRYDYGQASNFAAESGDWATIYTGGGLLDIRSIEKGSQVLGDSVYLGITKIWEAFTIGLASDMWSGIPYTQVTTSATPDTDAQFVIYDSVQAKLNEAIHELTVDTNSTHGPLGADLVFGGLATPKAQRAAWVKVAYSLKARYWLHVVNAATHGALGSFTAAQVYDSVIADALNGITDNTGGTDFRATHFSPTTQQNMWAQFQQFSGFGSDLEGGKPLVDYMKQRLDPRLPQYFCTWKVTRAWKADTAYKVGALIADSNSNVQQVTTAGTTGATQPAWKTAADSTTADGTVVWTNTGYNTNLPYGGDDFNSPPPAGLVANYACLPPRFGTTYGIPYVTWAENELMLAEAYNQTGNDATALTYLNAELASPGEVSGLGTLTPLPAVSATVTGAALLDSIMTEKWVVMFQNTESLMDYRRTCVPNIKVVAGNFLGIPFVPGRLFYPQSERNVNPTHIPPESVEKNAGLRTQADISTPCHP